MGGVGCLFHSQASGKLHGSSALLTGAAKRLMKGADRGASWSNHPMRRQIGTPSPGSRGGSQRLPTAPDLVL